MGLVVVCLSNLSFGQQTAQPAYCTNPGGGIQVGGAFTVSPEFGCLDFTNKSATTYATNPISPSGGVLTNLGYIFDFKDGSPLVFPPGKKDITVSLPGNYWILQVGNSSGTQYITCRVFEVLQTEQPDFDITSCGDKSVTVTFKDTPKNRKQGKYRIVWGDGNQDFSAQITVWPHQMSHTYAVIPVSKPQIVAEYTRGNSNFTVCKSEPIAFPVGVNSKPRISELEGLNGGGSDKITQLEGLDGKEYTIQQKLKGGTWVDTGKKITRNSVSVSANQTIDGLDGKQEYCFRLQILDGCANETFSNEVCTIIPKATILSLADVKIEWNNPDSDLTATPNVTRYSVGYNESPSGANPNTGAPTPVSGTTYIFDALECNKKYNFNITAFLGTTATDRVVIKSPNVLVDPTTVKELPAPNDPGIVSVLNSKTIKYSIFESAGFTKKYYIYRSINGNSFEKIAETANNFYDDKDLDLEKNYYCYAYKYENKCGIMSALSINKPCSIKLSIENTTLKWTSFIVDNKSAIKPEYYVELLDENGSVSRPLGNTIETFYEVSPTFAIEPNKILKFRILGRIKYNIDIGGVLTPFPFSAYSNNITYTPILSTLNESEILNIYPNPSEEIIKFNSTFQIKTVEIIDLQGKLLENQAVEGNQVSVKNIPKGKYILRLYDPKNKLIVNKTIVKM